MQCDWLSSKWLRKWLHLQRLELLVDALDLLAHTLPVVVHLVRPLALFQPLTLELQMVPPGTSESIVILLAADSLSLTNRHSHLPPNMYIMMTRHYLLQLGACVCQVGVVDAELQPKGDDAQADSEIKKHLLQLGAGVREVSVIDVELQGTALAVDLLVLLQVRAVLLQLRQLLP